jgi:methyl-accepting chemotaxis protein
VKEAMLRAEEGDESIDEMTDEAAKAKKELRESTEAGEKVQHQSKDSAKKH